MDIGPKIKSIRRAAHWSQTQCAERIGMSQSQWAQIEGGLYNDITLGTLDRIAAALRCSIGDLIAA